MMPLKRWLRGQLRHRSWLHPVRARLFARRAHAVFPDWRAVSVPDPPAGEGRGRVLVATSLGLHAAVAPIDSLVAAALKTRGAKVDVLLCDGALPACQLNECAWFSNPDKFIATGPDLCGPCFTGGSRMFSGLGVNVIRYSEILEAGEAEAIGTWVASLPEEALKHVEVDGIPVGEHAESGSLRFFARGDLSDEPRADAVRRRYLTASLIAERVAGRLFAKGEYTAAVIHHGIYVPQGVLSAAARRAGVRVATWNVAYRKSCFIFSHDDTYHHTLMDEPVDGWEGMAWTPEMEKGVLDYLASRAHGGHDWIRFLGETTSKDFAGIAARHGIDRSKPLIVALTNVIWDAQLHYPANAFATMVDWLITTVRWFAGHPELQLAIRVHPAEITGSVPSRQRMADELARAFPRLPDNVALILPEADVSTYTLAAAADCALIYGTKMGVELTAVGIPVIVAGEAWIRNKGVTWDATGREQYLELLGRLPVGRRLDPETVARARRYAYHFFFRRMIPVRSVVPSAGWPPFRVDPAQVRLSPGEDPGLDVICDGILNGTPFIYPAERAPS
jgi:hypothetical protein